MMKNELIDVLTNPWFGLCWNEEKGKAFRKAVVDLIYKHEALEERTSWIPCSEQLPKESGYYRVTLFDGHARRISFMKYFKTQKRWALDKNRAYWKFLAWMPNPEPYKEVEK